MSEKAHDWSRYEYHVLQEIERLAEDIKDVKDSVGETNAKVDRLSEDVAGLHIKTSIIGGASGFVGAMASFLGLNTVK